MIVDTHAHINIKEFADNIDDVINRASNRGVTTILSVGMNYETNLKSIELAKKYTGVYATVGVHPSDYKDDITKLEPLITAAKVVAIGECGLDLYHRNDNLFEQKEVFLKQIKLAEKYQLPLVIHTRNSFKEAYEMLVPYKGKVRGVFHCFSENLTEALKAVDLGFYIGIGGAVTFPSAKDLHHLVKYLPLNRMLVETDSPYVTPSPYRGKRNEPAYTSLVVAEIARIRKTSVEQVATITTKNARELFKI